MLRQKLKVANFQIVKDVLTRTDYNKEEYLEFHAVPKSQLNNKSALLCFMTSLSIAEDLGESISSSDAPGKFSTILYCLIESIKASLAALYKGRSTCAEIPNL